MFCCWCRGWMTFSLTRIIIFSLSFTYIHTDPTMKCNWFLNSSAYIHGRHMFEIIQYTDCANNSLTGNKTLRISWMRAVIFKYSLQTCSSGINSSFTPPLVCIKMLLCFSTMLWLYPYMDYKDTFVCLINGFHDNICHSHGHKGNKTPWLTCTEKVAHKLTCFEHGFKTLFHSSLYFQLTVVSGEILLWHRAKTKWNVSMERSPVLPLHMETIMCAQIKWKPEV